MNLHGLGNLPAAGHRIPGHGNIFRHPHEDAAVGRQAIGRAHLADTVDKGIVDDVVLNGNAVAVGGKNTVHPRICNGIFFDQDIFAFVVVQNPLLLASGTLPMKNRTGISVFRVALRTGCAAAVYHIIPYLDIHRESGFAPVDISKRYYGSAAAAFTRIVFHNDIMAFHHDTVADIVPEGGISYHHTGAYRIQRSDMIAHFKAQGFVQRDFIHQILRLISAGNPDIGVFDNGLERRVMLSFNGGDLRGAQRLIGGFLISLDRIPHKGSGVPLRRHPIWFCQEVFTT